MTPMFLLFFGGHLGLLGIIYAHNRKNYLSLSSIDSFHLAISFI